LKQLSLRQALVYVDASAFVKLFSPEPESEAMAAAIDLEWQGALSSEIFAIEVFRAARRIGGTAVAQAVDLLRSVVLLPLTAEIRRDAGRVGSPELRSLDAIHLATAISLGDRIRAVLTYDTRLGEACSAAGLSVVAPA
jgi:predicted nucleic acid-binding protein